MQTNDLEDNWDDKYSSQDLNDTKTISTEITSSIEMIYQTQEDNLY